MRLKKLEIAGFKSFADKTALSFHPGITAVVGTNGCGKSNISDAFRWVLRANNPQNRLRGSKMPDVIFAGTGHPNPSILLRHHYFNRYQWEAPRRIRRSCCHPPSCIAAENLNTLLISILSVLKIFRLFSGLRNG